VNKQELRVRIEFFIPEDYLAPEKSYLALLYEEELDEAGLLAGNGAADKLEDLKT
jgi:hypothetical protein